ncbi:LysR substrate-binding domain-containing protein [Variovorax sp. LjRoot290]|uniref:LysR substrate-binding domain-containing protein n=1 Tax=unclassified Variovorax TaxID=663243 RepID=UPI003ED0FBB3
MRFHNFDLNLLVALDVLLKERSVTRAAEALSLSPSAISNSLSRLREYFDDDLLVQIGRKMELTPRAEGLREAVRDLLLRFDSTIAAPPVFEPHASDRVFRIFSSDYAQLVLGPALMTLAAQQKARVRFEFAQQVAQPHRDLERGEADLLIIPTGFMSPDHPREVLYKEDFVCMVWRDAELARGELTFERYVSAEHVVMQPSNGRVDAFEGWFLKRYGVTRRVEVLTYSFITLLALLVGTNRVATVHERVARRLVGVWPLEIRPTPIKIDAMEQAMQWHKFRTNDPGLSWLRSLVAEAASRIDEY